LLLRYCFSGCIQNKQQTRGSATLKVIRKAVINVEIPKKGKLLHTVGLISGV
jgi:hypothetical protein